MVFSTYLKKAETKVVKQGMANRAIMHCVYKYKHLEVFFYFVFVGLSICSRHQCFRECLQFPAGFLYFYTSTTIGMLSKSKNFYHDYSCFVPMSMNLCGLGCALGCLFKAQNSTKFTALTLQRLQKKDLYLFFDKFALSICPRQLKIE